MRKVCHAFAESDVAITVAQLLSTSLQDGLRLLRFPYPHSFRLTLRLLSSAIARGRIRAYHVPRECQCGLGPAALPVARRLRQMS